MTYHQELGLSLVAFEPIVQGSEKVATLGINSYDHTISANGGFDSMTVTISDDRLSLDEWIEQGIGRRIVVYNSSNEICWEGFVNVVKAQMGAQSITVGPLAEVANRVSVAYAFMDTNFTPPVVNNETTTTLIAENEESQSRFGIIEKIINGGRKIDTEAEFIRDVYLREHAYPETSSELSIGGGSGSPSLTLECLGYWYWTNFYIYNSPLELTTTVQDKLTEIFTNNPNTGLFNELSIGTNLNIIPAYENDDKPAMAQIKEMLALGDGVDNRYILGVYENRKVISGSIPTTSVYKTALSDRGQKILTNEGSLVYPWDVRPGEWIFVSDSLIGRYTDTDNLYEDPRYMFIEQVKYSAPWQITLQGSRVGTFDQIMAKFGLGNF